MDGLLATRSSLCRPDRRHRRFRPAVAVAPFRAGLRASACVPRGPVVCALLAKGRGTGRRTPRPFSRPPDAVAASSPLGLACTRPANATAQDAWPAVCVLGDYGRPPVKRKRMLLSWRRGAARRLPVPVLAPRCCQAVAAPLVAPATADLVIFLASLFRSDLQKLCGERKMAACAFRSASQRPSEVVAKRKCDIYQHSLFALVMSSNVHSDMDFVQPGQTVR